MKKNKFALQITTFCLIILSFIACDTDFADLESDVLNSDIATNFDILSEQHDIITYTKNLGPVQSNGLGLSTLGIYEDIYGKTTSSFVSQLTTSTFNPSFGENVEIDSVVVTMPFYSTATGTDDDGNTIYQIDSVISKGGNFNNIKLRIFESNYFIRDFDPNASFNENQAYFSNKSASQSEMITTLEGTELTMIRDYETSYLPLNSGQDENIYENVITITDEGFILEEPDNDEDEDTDPQIIARQSPGIRVKLDPVFWQNKIINREGDPVLSNQNNFAEYFRGLYLKAESFGNYGTFFILDTNSENANITIYYKDTEDPTETGTFILRFGPNKINFLDNEFPQTIEDRILETGDSRLYLKGGEGAIAGIKLFNGEDLDDDPNENTFEAFKNIFVETDSDGNFVKSKRLINEANLVFYVDRDQLDLLNEDNENEPNRLYLYDIDNKTPLLDYILDATNTDLPSFSKLNHLGPLQRIDGEGVKYKLRITEHINNLLIRDSTNVELGLAVSLNVNIENTALASAQSEVQNSDDFTVPISSILTPRGTILHGNSSEDETKRVYLEIYYTEPN